MSAEMKAQCGLAHVQELGSALLFQLSFDNSDNAQQIMAKGGIEVVVAGMQVRRGGGNATQSGGRALWLLALSMRPLGTGWSFRREQGAAGVRMHGQSVSVQEAGCHAVQTLAVTLNNLAKMRCSGAFEVTLVTASVQKHATSHVVQSRGGAVLAKLQALPP